MLNEGAPKKSLARFVLARIPPRLTTTKWSFLLPTFLEHSVPPHHPLSSQLQCPKGPPSSSNSRPAPRSLKLNQPPVHPPPHLQRLNPDYCSKSAAKALSPPKALLLPHFQPRVQQPKRPAKQNPPPKSALLRKLKSPTTRKMYPLLRLQLRLANRHRRESS